MRSTRRLMEQMTKGPRKRYTNMALATTGVVAVAALTKAAYEGQKEHDLAKATHIKMQEVRSNLQTFEDLLTELRKVEKPEDYMRFWKHLYFNMHRNLLKSTRDYGTLLLEVNRFVERYYDLHPYTSDRTKTIAMHDEIINIILTNMVKEKLVTEMDLYQLLDTVYIAEESRKQRYYARSVSYSFYGDEDEKAFLPYEDFQAYLIQQLLPYNIDGIFQDNTGMIQLLKCDCISEKAKELLLGNADISARYFANISGYQDFNLLIERAAPENMTVIMREMLKNKSALANLKQSLNNASLADIKEILTNLRDARYESLQTGVNQKHFLQALGDDHPAVVKVRESMHALVDKNVLLLDATLYLNSTNKETFCAGRVGMKH